jgi:hypothetical protein
MIGPAGLEERPAYRRTLGKIHFTFLAASCETLLESRHKLAGRSSNEVLLKRSALSHRIYRLKSSSSLTSFNFDST